MAIVSVLFSATTVSPHSQGPLFFFFFFIPAQMNELPIEGFLLGPTHRNDEHLLYTPFSFLRPSATSLTIKSGTQKPLMIVLVEIRTEEKGPQAYFGPPSLNADSPRRFAPSAFMRAAVISPHPPFILSKNCYLTVFQFRAQRIGCPFFLKP